MNAVRVSMVLSSSTRRPPNRPSKSASGAFSHRRLTRVNCMPGGGQLTPFAEIVVADVSRDRQCLDHRLDQLRRHRRHCEFGIGSRGETKHAERETTCHSM